MSFDSIKNITPILTIAGIVLAFIAAFGSALKPQYKKAVFRWIAFHAQIGKRPNSLAFYGLMTIVSAAFTAAIIILNGSFGSFGGERSAFVQAFKSSGPLMLSAFLKIIVWDYLLAIKSHIVFSWWRDASFCLPKAARAVSGVVVITADVLLTGYLTASFLNWSNTFQSHQANTINQNTQQIAKTVTDYFKVINLAVAESVRNCFYVLNGCTFFYAALLFSTFASGWVGI